jgi:hypothetical protein
MIWMQAVSETPATLRTTVSRDGGTASSRNRDSARMVATLSLPVSLRPRSTCWASADEKTWERNIATIGPMITPNTSSSLRRDQPSYTISTHMIVIVP